MVSPLRINFVEYVFVVLLIEFSVIFQLRHLRRADEPCGGFERNERRGRPPSLLELAVLREV